MDTRNPFPRTWLDIDLEALAHNLSLVRAALPPRCQLGLVAKADAYGHGLVPIARTVSKHSLADWLCVATVQEGVAIREAGIELPTLVISPTLAIEAEQAIYYNLRVVVESLEVAMALSNAADRQGKTALIHLETDTGLSRFGCLPEEAPSLAKQIRALPKVELEGFCQHYINSADDPVRTSRQSAIFDDLAQRIGPVKFLHACNSAGVYNARHETHQLVRVGILAYGIDPFGVGNSDLQPVLTWNARITALRTAIKGTTVSYNATFECPRDTVVATLGVGYGDGYPRYLSDKGVAAINGRQVPVIGLVCMDQMMVDVTGIPGIQLGDIVQLVSPDVPVTQLSNLADTNVHEITTRIMGRVPRRYLPSVS